MTEDEAKTGMKERAGKAFLETVGAVALLLMGLAVLWFVPVILGAACMFFWPDFITNDGEPQKGAWSAWLLGVFLSGGLVVIGAAVVGLHGFGREIFASQEEEAP
jgi:hypothetical protein